MCVYLLKIGGLSSDALDATPEKTQKCPASNLVRFVRRVSLVFAS